MNAPSFRNSTIAILFELWNFPSLWSEPPRPLTGPPLLSQGGDKISTVHCFFPALDKAGWREAPGRFEAVIPQPGSDSYMNPALSPAPCRDLKAGRHERTQGARVEFDAWREAHPDFTSAELLENWRRIRVAWGLSSPDLQRAGQ